MGHHHLGAAATASGAVSLLLWVGLAAAHCPDGCCGGAASAAGASTTLTILCREGDIVEVCGYRLSQDGPDRKVCWSNLVPGKWYEATVRVTRAGRSYETTVRVQGGSHRHLDLRDCLGIRPSSETKGDRNFGLDPSRISDGVVTNVSRDEILAYIQANDSKPRVTVVAPPDAIERIRKELEPLGATALVQVYPPGHWALKRAKLDVQPTTVIVQYPDGVVFASEPYQGLAQVQALLQRYQAGTAIPDLPAWAWVLAGIVLGWILFGRR